VVNEKVYVERLLRQYGANVVVIRNDYIVFETAGHREEIDKLTEELTKYGLIEFVRGARIAIIKDSAGFHSKLVQFEAKEPSIEIVENEYLDKRDDVFTM
jgi:acetolactate synthase-1/3 small subunit